MDCFDVFCYSYSLIFLVGSYIIGMVFCKCLVLIEYVFKICKGIDYVVLFDRVVI